VRAGGGVIFAALKALLVVAVIAAIFWALSKISDD
jgi:hypothetical protein